MSMDFIDRRGTEIEEQRKQVEQTLALFGRQIDEMDSKIRAYLADKRNRPHPRHLDLIERIQGFKIPNSVFTKQLAVLLDNLQWKLHYNKQAWNQLWENAEAQSKKQTGTSSIESIAGSSTSEDGDARIQTKSQYSLDTLWEIQQEKLRFYGCKDNPETKVEFKKRMVQEYKTLSQGRKQGQEIIMTFDKESLQCKLDVK
ncbi:MAG: hypothetical protein WA081_15870 [Desulfosalsimonadaceae bacterium]